MLSYLFGFVFAYLVAFNAWRIREPWLDEGDVENARVEIHKLKEKHFQRQGVLVVLLRTVNL